MNASDIMGATVTGYSGNGEDKYGKLCLTLKDGRRIELFAGRNKKVDLGSIVVKADEPIRIG